MAAVSRPRAVCQPRSITYSARRQSDSPQAAADPGRSELAQSLGTRTLRKEDPALLSGRGRYADDLPVPTGTLHAHVVRSQHAHAKILKIDPAAALAQP